MVAKDDSHSVLPMDYIEVLSGAMHQSRPEITEWIFASATSYSLCRRTRFLVVTCLDRFFARCGNSFKSLRPLWLGIVATLLAASKSEDSARWADRDIVDMPGGMFSPGDVTKRGISLVIAFGGAVGMPVVSDFD